MGKQRSNLGFEDELDGFNPSDWGPPASRAANDRPASKDAQAAAEAAGFKSREPGQGTSRRQRRRRTGRNTQFNIKTTPAAIEEFCAIADAMNWGLGETFEKALPLLRREFLPESATGKE